ncbi:GIY-YIG nuclease family protein [Microbacterium sp. BF1]|uniref:GIY-YIG nuclease family protein n=1 Tax=Microbacterium sp. BF1 TaxID=2821146 RepID=UPI001C4DF055|nr:hypothetical protein [Microbacterium sp. BF1]
MSTFDDAIDALRAKRWSITEAPDHVPSRPGLYAIYGDTIAWNELGLTPMPDLPLYVGKAEESLARRELQGHFAVDPRVKAQTGSSTVRRSFASLLRGTLELQGIPRNPAKPGYFSNFGLSIEQDLLLTRWIHDRLSLAVWSTPPLLETPLADIERHVIRRWTPPLNLSENPTPAPGLKAARTAMAAEAKAWRPAT